MKENHIGIKRFTYPIAIVNFLTICRLYLKVETFSISLDLLAYCFLWKKYFEILELIFTLIMYCVTNN